MPFKGGAAAATAVAAGDVPFGVSSIPGLMPHLNSGRVKVLAVTTSKRASFQPDWPTPTELGVGDIDATLWIGLFAPKGTPPAIVEKIDAEVRQTLQNSEVRSRFADIGYEAVGAPPQEFMSRIRRDVTRYRDIVRAAGIKAE